MSSPSAHASPAQVSSRLELLATGSARFSGDLPLPPGCLHALPAVSPHAHARFSRIETAAALAEPGVIAVFTAADIPGANQISNLAHDEPLLAAGEVHCVGQPFALVVADSADGAWRGSRLVTADWQPLPACFDARAAFAAGELIQPPRTFSLGDVDAAWAACATVVSGEVDIGSAEHVYLETQCALALPRDDGGVSVHSATQSPSSTQKAVAAILGLAMHLVEIEVERLGGGFGGKEEQATLWACLAALAAKSLGRPVRAWPERRDDMAITGKRHPYQADFRIGLDDAGRFVAYEARLLQNAGWCADLSTAILERSLFHATNAYFIPNVRVTAASCRTNLPSNTAFRGFGAPQGIFVIEAAIRAAARELGVPAEVLQAKNLLSEGDAFPYGMRIAGACVGDCWQALAPAITARRAEFARWNAGKPRRRKGLAVVPVCFGISFTATLLNQAEALVHVYVDGSVVVSTGAVDMGQGVYGKIQRVVALTLGIPEALVRIAGTSTLRVANVSPTAASTGADLNGAAAREACLVIAGGLRRVAGELLDCPPGSIGFSDGVVAGGEKTLGWRELVAAAYARRVCLSALAHYATPGLFFDRERNQGQPFAYHVQGVALVEASVDVLLGSGRVDRVEVVHDIGRSLDRVADLGQIEGALVQGIGWMTCEEIVRDDAGRLLSDSLATYKIPDLDSAPEIDIRLREGEGGPGAVLNSKAVGEPPLVYGLGAYFALQEAIASWRPEAAAVFRTPLSSERIFMLLHGLA